MIKRVILDLDDTLNSLTMHILSKLGCGVGAFDYDKFPVECGYDIIEAWAKLTNREPVDVSVFWEWISRHIWETAPPSRQYAVIFDSISKISADNILIATSPTKSADCLFAKYQWITQYLPMQIHRQYSITPRKSWLAKPGVLLVDDCDKNIDEFRKEGGEGILVPRPWNSLHRQSLDQNEINRYLHEKFRYYLGN